MRLAAIGPRHLGERGIAEIDTADLAAPERVVAGVEQNAAALDLIERAAQLLGGTFAGLATRDERGDPRLVRFAREHVGEQRREYLPAIEQCATHVFASCLFEPHDA